jgi:GH43 family beta-xylosidase
MFFNNFILPPPSPDPWIIQIDGFYYFCRSEKDQGISITKSKTITGIGDGEKRTVWKSPDVGMYSRNVWAPEIHLIQGKWYIYFAADDGDNNNHRMWVLESTSDDPLGSYVLKGKITDPSDKWAIDGTVLMKDDSSLYFIWSGWPEQQDTLVQNLYIAPMSDPLTISSGRVLISEPKYDWECFTCENGPLVNEGPQVILYEGRIHIVYSASHSSIEDYCLGLLTLTDGNVLNPECWVKTPFPIFAKDVEAGVYAVGHCSFTLSPDLSEHWILYHAMSDLNGGWENRSTRGQPFTWDAERKPHFGKPLPLDRLINVPSGEGHNS